MKKLLLLTLLVFLGQAVIFAREISVSGTVTDAYSGQGIPGVNVVNNGNVVGTVTDMDGACDISVPSQDIPAEILNDSISVYRIWNFHQNNDPEDWTIPDALGGIIFGGALWLSFPLPEFDIHTGKALTGNRPERPNLGFHNIDRHLYIKSPAGLNISCDKAKKLRMRILNLSPETNVEVRWNTLERSERYHITYFSMEPYSRHWQEIVCDLDDDECEGILNQIEIKPGLLGMRGDIYIDWIAITDGEKSPVVYTKPSVNKTDIVPRVEIPGITQADFQMAFDVLDDAIIYENLPFHGFPYPVITPGALGMYNHNWWLLDATLTIPALKWVNPEFCENMIRGFMNIQSQNPDGRIDHSGAVKYRGGPSDVSVLPRCYFEGAYHVFSFTEEHELKKEIFHSLKSYLNWWLTPVKRDMKTGLITGYHEETFSWPYWRDRTRYPNEGNEEINIPGEIAQVDLNVSVVMGCHIVADLAGYLGYHAESEFYRVIGKGLTDSINKFMWNEEREAYFSYNIIEGKQVPQLIGYTFDVFRFNIAPPERCEKLVSKLTDPDLFNWGNIPLTTIAKTDDSFISYKGDFKQKAWDGNVWTLKNMIIIDGLKDIGRYDLSAELNWKTIQVFNANYVEFIEPAKGTGFGVRRYCWSAAQYIQAIIQNLFGIEYDQIANQLLISPSIPSELIGEKLSIRNLHIPSMDQNRLDLSILMSADGDLTIELDLQNKLDGLKTVIQYNYPATIKDIKVIDLLENQKAEMNYHPYYSRGALAVPLPVREEYKVMIHRIK